MFKIVAIVIIAVWALLDLVHTAHYNLAPKLGPHQQNSQVEVQPENLDFEELEIYKPQK